MIKIIDFDEKCNDISFRIFSSDVRTQLSRIFCSNVEEQRPLHLIFHLQKFRLNCFDLLEKGSPASLVGRPRFWMHQTGRGQSQLFSILKEAAHPPPASEDATDGADTFASDDDASASTSAFDDCCF